MKTTIDLPDALAAEAKALAQEQGSTLRDLVVTGLRREISHRQAMPRADFHFPTFGGHGPLIEVDVMAHSYGLPAEGAEPDPGVAGPSATAHPGGR